MSVSLRKAEDPLLDDLVATVGVAAILAVVVLRMSTVLDVPGHHLQIAAVALSAIISGAVTIVRREWWVLWAPAALITAVAVSIGLAAIQGYAPILDVSTLLWLLAIWGLWPQLRSRSALGVFWALALAPTGMLLANPLVGAEGWLSDLAMGGRLGGAFHPNSLGVNAALAVICALALRRQHDTAPRYVLLCVCAAQAGLAGTRSVVPALVLAAAIVLHDAFSARSIRKLARELLPWAIYATTISLRLLPTWDRVSDIDQFSSGRVTLWTEYGERARDALLAGHGIGSVDVLRDGVLSTSQDPHNAILYLLVEVGLVGTVVASVGFGITLIHRIRAVQGTVRWFLRIPMIVLLPGVLLLDSAVRESLLLVPLMLYAAAAARVAETLDSPPHQPALMPSE